MVDYIQYVAGQKACELGKPCPDNASESFLKGYADQYVKEQTETAKSERN